MKRITSFFLVLVMTVLLIPAVPGFALEETFQRSVSAEVDYSTNALTITGNIGANAEKLVNIVVIKDGYVPNVSDLDTGLIFVGETETDEKGAFSCDEAIIPEDASGDYKVIVSAENDAENDNAPITDTFFYADDNVRVDAIREINEMNASTATAVLEAYAAVIDINVTGDYITYASAVNAAMLTLRPEGKYDEANASTISTIREDFKEALWVGTMAKADNVATPELKAESKTRIIDSMADYKKADYEANENVVWEKFLLSRESKDMTTTAAVEKTFNEVLALIMINASNRHGLVEVLSNYESVLPLNSETERDALDSYKDMEETDVTRILESRDYTDLDDFCEAFVDAVKKVIKDAKDDDRHSSGGGGGSSSSSITISPVVTPAAPAFTDVKGHWAEAQLTALVNKGVLNGYGDNTIRPNGIITREEFLKMVIDALGYTKGGATANLTDVNPSAWYAPYINTAVTFGISTGKGDGTFGIGETIKRQDMAVLACRALEKLGVTLNAGATAFTDKASIDNYALESVAKLSNANIISGRGDGSFCPNDFATRAEAAKIICGVMSQREEAGR